MRKLMLLAATIAMASCVVPAAAQQSTDKPKSTEGQVRKARKEDHAVRQVTPDPKKSPAKHADNLSKNVNHETNRTSKHINRMFQHHSKKKDQTHTSK